MEPVPPLVPDGHGGRFCRPASVGPFGDLSGHLGFAERVEPFDDPVRGHIMRFGCGVAVVGSGIAVRVRVGQPIPPLFGHMEALAFEQLVDDRQVGFRRGHVLRVELGLGKDLGDVVVLGGGERGFDLVGRLLHGLGLLGDDRGVDAFLEVVAAADQDDAAHLRHVRAGLLQPAQGDVYLVGVGLALVDEEAGAADGDVEVGRPVRIGHEPRPAVGGIDLDCGVIGDDAVADVHVHRLLLRYGGHACRAQSHSQETDSGDAGRQSAG